MQYENYFKCFVLITCFFVYFSNARNVTLPLGEEIKARVDVHQTSQHNVHTFETVINHQAEEIVDLKKQLAQSESMSHKQISRLENQLMLKDSQHLQELTMFKSEHEALREKYDTEKEASDALQSKLSGDYQSIVTSHKQKLDMLQQQKDCEVSQLQAELSVAQTEATDRLLELNEKEKNFDLKLEAQKQSLQQMKVYLQQSEENFKSTAIWRKEIENLNSQLKTVKSENSQVQKESELTTVRLKSQNEIMAIQEQELSKLSDSLPERKKQCLLSLWRNKVYELMVQLKCHELTAKDTDRTWVNKLHNYENALSTVKAQCDVLQHTLQDKQAELEIEQQQVTKLKRDLSQADEVALHLDTNRKETEASLHGLVQFTENVLEKYTALEAEMKVTTSSLNSYNQRIAFASGRVEMLQSQFARREALIKIHTQEAAEERTRAAQPDTEEPEKEDEEDGNILQQLLDELERVTAERDQLASQLKADSEMMHDKITIAKQQTIDEISELKQRLQEMHTTLDETTEECEALNQRLSDANQALQESGETIRSLKQQLENAAMKGEKDLEDVRKEEELKVVDQLAQMEHKLNETRREQTKDIVKVRQMERQMARDKERAAEHVQKLEQFYKEQSAKLEHKLKMVERDRNILLNTIRQEGLLAKYQLQRGTPRELDSDDEGSEHVPLQGSKTDNGDALPYTPPTYGETQKDEPLHEVIDDLKKLAATVLDDEVEMA